MEGHAHHVPLPYPHHVPVAPGDDFALLGKVCGVFRPFQESAIVEAVEAREEAPVS